VNEQQLLAAVLAAPESLEPRLVLGDFWQQEGNPRGELVAVQCRLASLGEKDKARAALEKRESELLKKHGKAWSKVAGPGKLKFERGFARAWKGVANRFPTIAAALFAVEPIRVVDFSQGNAMDPTAPDTVRAFARAELARVRRLEMRRLKLRADELEKIVRCDHLAELRELDLSYVPMSLKAVAALTGAPAFTKLELLRLSGCKIDARAIDALAKAPFAKTLRSLDVGSSALGDDAVLALAMPGAFPALESLDVSRLKIAPNTRAALARAKHIARVTFDRVAT